MKIRIASMILAFGLTLSTVTVAFASGAGEDAAALQDAQGQTEQTAQFYLDGEPLYDVVAKSINGTYYVTLASMLPLIDSSAIVEESSGTAAATAQAVVVEAEEDPVPAQEDPAQVPEELQDGQETPEEDPALTAVQALGAGARLLTTPVEGPAAQMEGDGQPEPEETPEAVVEVVDTLTLTAQVGEQYVVANGRYLYVEEGVIALDGAVAIPVRVLAEAMDLTTEYDAQTGLVHLTSDEDIGYLEDGESYYDADDLYWLSRIIYSESGNQVLDGKIAVGNVVLNRVNDSRFPDTIYDVIFQKNQFSPASSGSIYREPNGESVIAAKLALDGAVVLEDALFFNRAGLVCYASKNRPYITTIGGHSFYA